jgi:hypothetical protein
MECFSLPYDTFEWRPEEAPNSSTHQLNQVQMWSTYETKKSYEDFSDELQIFSATAKQMKNNTAIFTCSQTEGWELTDSSVGERDPLLETVHTCFISCMSLLKSRDIPQNLWCEVRKSIANLSKLTTRLQDHLYFTSKYGRRGVQIWRTMNIFNNHVPTEEKGWSSSLKVGRRVNISSP